jgi:uncharacterized cofD-like protein
VIGPGGLHTSLIANLLVEGVAEAVLKSKAVKVFVVNLMNRKGQTTNFKVSDYIKEISKFIGGDVFDYILVNNEEPPEELIEVYREEGDLVKNDMDDPRVLAIPLLGGLQKEEGNDLMKRNLIRHDSQKLAEALIKIVGKIEDLCCSFSI